MKGHEFPVILLMILVFPVVVSGQKSFAEMKDHAGFIKRFNEATASINTIESSFTQEKNLSMLSDKIITRGKFYFKKEKQLRWEYTDPLIIFRDDRIFIRDEEKETRFDTRENRMFGEINAIILGSVRGNLFSDEKRFSSAFFESPSQVLIKMKPLSPQLKEYLDEIRIFFDKSDMTVAALEMQELNGDYTKIVFTSKKLNTNIPDEKFAFQ